MSAVEWSLRTKACLICAVKKELNNFYPRSMHESVEVQLRPYLASWLEDYLKVKIEVLLGLLFVFPLVNLVISKC